MRCTILYAPQLALKRLLTVLAFLPLLVAHASPLYAQPAPGSANLEIFTSPIDVTGLRSSSALLAAGCAPTAFRRRFRVCVREGSSRSP